MIIPIIPQHGQSIELYLCTGLCGKMWRMAERWKPFIALFIGLFAVSTAAIFIRLAQEENTPSLLVAAGRLTVAAVVLTPYALKRYRVELQRLRPSDIRLGILSGAVLGLHFATWISSLEYTSVINSVVLVTTNPLWVALMAPFILGERISRWTIAGLALAFGGGVLVALSGESGTAPTRSDPLLGNGLALFGAIMAAIYFIIGRRLRARLTLIPYIWLVYSTAAVFLLVMALLWGHSLAQVSGLGLLWIIMLGLVPQLIGHSTFNYALGFLPAAYVSLIVLGEPIGSGVLAAVFLNEMPVGLQALGAALILLGIATATQDQLRPKRKHAR